MQKLIISVLGNYINAMTHVLPSHAASVGFRLFCTPFRVSLKSHQKDFLDSGSKTEMLVDGQRIAVYKWNNGPRKVLFLHGWQSHSFRWKNYIEQLPPSEYTVYSIDAPGHGLSSGSFLTVPVYSRVVENFLGEHGPVDTIVSHSLGSFTTLYTLAENPELRAERLVLLASPGEAAEFLAFYSKTLKLSDKAVNLIKSYFEKKIGKQIEEFSAIAYAKKLNVDTLIIHDEEDVQTSHTNSIAIHEALKSSKLILTKGLSHNLKSPSVVNAVTEFVGKKAVESV